MYVIDEAITGLLDEIAEKQKYVDKLKNFEEFSKKGLSELEYHDYCETSMRYSELLGDALTVIFPFLTFVKKSPNYFHFKIDGYDKVEVLIPNNRSLGINVYFRDYMNEPAVFERTVNQQYLIRVTELQKRIEKYEKYLTTNSVIEKAKIVFPYDKLPVSVFKLFTMHNVYNRQSYVHKLNEATEKLKALQMFKDEDLAEKKRVYLEQQRFIEEFVPQFLKWTRTVYLYEAGWNRVEAVCRMKDGTLIIENNNY